MEGLSAGAKDVLRRDTESTTSMPNTSEPLSRKRCPPPNPETCASIGQLVVRAALIYIKAKGTLVERH